MARHFIVLFVLLACAAPAAAQRAAQPAEVALIGIIGGGAAVLAVDGGNPITIKTGQTRSGITVVSIERERATIEFQGQQRVLSLGQHYRNPASMPSGPSGQTVVLAADPRGHFISEGSINGHSVRFVVDTGATTIAIPAADAIRLGIDYRKGIPAKTRTAGGVVDVYRVTFDTVRLGNIEISQVEGIVIEQGLDIALLGMTFLNRLDLRQEGRTMTLIKRF